MEIAAIERFLWIETSRSSGVTVLMLEIAALESFLWTETTM